MLRLLILIESIVFGFLILPVFFASAVMELVEDEPEYPNTPQLKLTLRERLELFAKRYDSMLRGTAGKTTLLFFKLRDYLYDPLHSKLFIWVACFSAPPIGVYLHKGKGLPLVISIITYLVGLYFLSLLYSLTVIITYEKKERFVSKFPGKPVEQLDHIDEVDNTFEVVEDILSATVEHVDKFE
jgi:uncharacterized membrane protein YqaE (UPF0057 family)